MKNLVLLLITVSSSLLYSQNILLTEFASGFTAPVEIANNGDSRLFVVQQNGAIKILLPNGTVNASNFINLSSKITYNGERGLLGLAFHPQYANNGFFYVYFNNTAGNITVARYSVNASNPDIADLSSEKILLNITKPFPNHNGGSMHFAPDGNLWISTGDGGSSGDPNNNSQNKNSLLGKMLRIDVNSSAAYSIPASNPFVGIDGSDEIWSYGLRNAWKFSFDPITANVLIADVGQGQFEEINKMPISQAGINYGWRCYEGNSTYDATGCAPMNSMTFPLVAYDHSGGKCSITGGYVYRGSLYPALSGKYFFADYCSQQIGMLNADNSIVWTNAFSGSSFSTFGVDSNQELYVAAVNNGKIYKISTSTLSTENNEQNTISLYPNPASEIIFIKGLKTKNNSAEFINSEGRKILAPNISDNGKIDISKLPSGVYFVNVKSGDQKIYSQKVIIR